MKKKDLKKIIFQQSAEIQRLNKIIEQYQKDKKDLIGQIIDITNMNYVK